MLPLSALCYMWMIDGFGSGGILMAAASEGQESDVTQCSLEERMMMRMMMVMRPCDLIKSWLVLPMWSLRLLWASSAAAMIIFLHLSIKKCGWEYLFLEFLWLVFYHFLSWQLCIILTLYLDMLYERRCQPGCRSVSPPLWSRIKYLTHSWITMKVSTDIVLLPEEESYWLQVIPIIGNWTQNGTMFSIGRFWKLWWSINFPSNAIVRLKFSFVCFFCNQIAEKLLELIINSN